MKLDDKKIIEVVVKLESGEEFVYNRESKNDSNVPDIELYLASGCDDRLEALNFCEFNPGRYINFGEILIRGFVKKLKNILPNRLIANKILPDLVLTMAKSFKPDGNFVSDEVLRNLDETIKQ